MVNNIMTRMGDGRLVYTSKEEILADIQEGMADGADAANAPDLTADDIDNLYEIIACPYRAVGVKPGDEVVFTEDAVIQSLYADSGNCCNGVDMGRLEASLVLERAMAIDTVELAHVDYSIKAVKPVIAYEAQAMEEISMNTTLPYLYGAMPNMGLYYAPDGPHGNPADLMREFRIEEAQTAMVNAADQLTTDIEYVASAMFDAGAEGFNFDTVGSAGDGDLLGTLRGIEALRKEYPDVYINLGMASENVIGIHGELDFHGKTLAGIYPNEQVKLAEMVGANIFGAVVNANTSKSLAWNIARAAVIVKDCVKNSNIPVHVDQGMGVGGVPMSECPAVDAVSRANKALIEIAHVDGI